jgi:uncharacterized protein
MAIAPNRVREIFSGLESGEGTAFFDHVAVKLGGVLTNGAQLHIEHLMVKDDQAVVELYSLATAKNGMRFDNRYCWVVYFQDGVVVRVRIWIRPWSPDCSTRIRLHESPRRLSLDRQKRRE